MDTLDKTIKQHKTKFKKDARIINYHRDRLDISDDIQDAIEANTPYNEYDLLTPEEQKAYDAGKLLF
jgi:hypothetical protein